MGKIKKEIKKMSLKQSLLVCILIVLVLAAMLSTMTVFVTSEMQQRILETRNLVIENYSYDLIETENGQAYNLKPSKYTFEALSTKNQILYYIVMAAMVALPVFYIASGMFIIVKMYYSLKLKEPLCMLKMGMEHIMSNDLDFSLSSDSDDELGMLCNSFESMRDELYKNNQRMWEMLRERKALAASVSHDLRTPITVIKGYLEFLMKEAGKGSIMPDTLQITLENMMQSTERLERYVECLKDIQKMEDIETEKATEKAGDILSEIQRTIPIVADHYKKEFILQNKIESSVWYIDKHILFRVLENVLNNAFRFARTQVAMSVSEEKDAICFRIQDDGSGFTEEELQKAGEMFYSSPSNKGTFGIGLYISKILCKKMEGALRLENSSPCGASVEIKIKK